VKTALVVTSISPPNAALQELAAGARRSGYEFIVIGDRASPEDFQLDGCEFYSIARQEECPFSFARLCPTRHYARKNIGYLLAIRAGASLIIETDDDNIPQRGFWSARELHPQVPHLSENGWTNVYRYFTEATIWPRGLPLDAIHDGVPPFEALSHEECECPIQQGLCDGDPDVDAIYRITLPLPQTFRSDRRIALGRGSWCPFNSQNTAWWPQAYPLLYLPAFCSFRMTDIWRSLIAQRIAWTNGWSILFHEPNVIQERNQHSLMRDFTDELPGYLNNRAIAAALDELDLEPGAEHIAANLRKCYQLLIARSWLGAGEMELLHAWLDDLAATVNV
jgi:hypothetical protein